MLRTREPGKGKSLLVIPALIVSKQINKLTQITQKKVISTSHLHLYMAEFNISVRNKKVVK